MVLGTALHYMMADVDIARSCEFACIVWVVILPSVLLPVNLNCNMNTIFNYGIEKRPASVWPTQPLGPLRLGAVWILDNGSLGWAM